MPGRETRRRRYLPDELRVLFIGESPPSGPTFFYDANSILHHATRDAFVAADARLASLEFLTAFQRMGCYLDDLSHAPINTLDKPNKRAARDAAAPGLARRLRRLSPRVIVIVVIDIQRPVTTALRRAGLDATPVELLPFPNAWHRRRYVDELAALVAQWRRRRILRSPRAPKP